MCTVLLPPGDNPIAVNKYIDINIKLYDESVYTCDMSVYLGKDSHSATDNMTGSHATVRHLTCRVEGLGHKIFMDNFFLMTWRNVK